MLAAGDATVCTAVAMVGRDALRASPSSRVRGSSSSKSGRAGPPPRVSACDRPRGSGRCGCPPSQSRRVCTRRDASRVRSRALGRSGSAEGCCGGKGRDITRELTKAVALHVHVLSECTCVTWLLCMYVYRSERDRVPVLRAAKRKRTAREGKPLPCRRHESCTVGALRSRDVACSPWSRRV